MKIKIRDIKIDFNGKKILDRFNLDIEEGEFVGILGHSGSGKSTLLNLIAGMLNPDTGAITIDGEPVSGISFKVAYMPQDDLLIPWKNIIDNVTLYSKVNGGIDEAKSEAAKRLEEFGLQGYGKKYPYELSGGMRQRAAFLRTSLCNAEIMLLDEPFASLDVITRKEMQVWLKEKMKILNSTTVLVTHDIDEAMSLCDRIVVLSGQPAEIKEEIIVNEPNRTTAWLSSQIQLKEKIIKLL